jgi:predicted metalloprotease
MRWEGRRESENVDDRRRLTGGRAALGGGIGTIIIVIIAIFMGVDPRALLQDGSIQVGGGPASVSTPDPADDRLAKFTSVVLADTEDVWHELFRKSSKTYREPTLVLFRRQVESACGYSSSATGPFYCPADEKVYIDLSFFQELNNRFRSPGDFAQAYVLAHEVGHHVQKQLGISDQVDRQRSRLSKQAYNELSVRLELQADFFAGVWAHHAEQMKKILEAGDVEEALRAASAIGDDRIQMQAQGYVVPESFTHGTSKQRLAWFRKGLETGDMRQGDTFNLPDP